MPVLPAESEPRNEVFFALLPQAMSMFGRLALFVLALRA